MQIIDINNNKRNMLRTLRDYINRFGIEAFVVKEKRKEKILGAIMKNEDVDQLIVGRLMEYNNYYILYNNFVTEYTRPKIVGNNIIVSVSSNLVKTTAAYKILTDKGLDPLVIKDIVNKQLFPTKAVSLIADIDHFVGDIDKPFKYKKESVQLMNRQLKKLLNVMT